MSRINQINESIKQGLANILNQELELPNVLVTVTYVNCSEDLNYARVGISVLPEKMFGTTLKVLRSKSGYFAKLLNNKMKVRKIPKISWVLDSTEKEAGIIERAISEDRNIIENIKENN